MSVKDLPDHELEAVAALATKAIAELIKRREARAAQVIRVDFRNRRQRTAETAAGFHR